MASFEAVDITSHAFASRLANLLVATRTRNGRGVGSMAKASEGRFSKRDLKAFEAADRTLDDDTIDELAQLYGCDLGVILPLRLPVTVSPDRVSAGGVDQPFESSNSDAMLAAYLTLVRTLRHQKKAPVVDLRRDDVEVLAGFLSEPSETVINRLATLMHATQAKRTAMVGAFATGAAVIGLVGTALAVGGTSTSPSDTIPNTSVATSTTVAASDTGVATTDSIATSTPTPVSTAPSTATTVPGAVVRTVPGAVVTTIPADSTTTTMPPLIETPITGTAPIVSTGEAPVPPGPPNVAP